jgi:hypothetical protein
MVMYEMQTMERMCCMWYTYFNRVIDGGKHEGKPRGSS